MKRKQTSITNKPAVANRERIRKSAPHSGPSDFLQRLHATAGNRAAGHWIQAKLKIGAPNDAYEQEAERVADQAMRASNPAAAPGNSISGEPSVQLQRKCLECEEEETKVQRQETGPGPGVAPPIVGHVLDSPGQPLDSATRNFMEPRLGHDFRGVRIHTGPEAAHSARAIDALAYTVGNHIAFAQGQYTPHTDSGRRLIAHELTHVVQQAAGTRSSSGASQGGPASVVQRDPQPQTSNPPAPMTIPNTAKDRGAWIARVDKAIRDLYKLSGVGLTDANVRFLNEQQFAGQFAGQSLEDKLYSLFIDYGYNPHICPNGTPFGNILDFNHVTYGTVGYFDPEFTLSGHTILTELREFVRKGIAQGFFMGQGCGPVDVSMGKRPGPFRFTPQELITRFIAGVTDISAPRSTRHISIQGFKEKGRELKPKVSTLAHEACHFYISNNFRDMAQGRKDGDSVIGGERISEVLIEGFAEYFAREVLRKNEKLLGPAAQDAYSTATKNASILIAFIGENHARAAYFGGDKRYVEAISRLVDDWKKFGGDSPPVDVITGADPRAETPKHARPHSPP